MFYNNNDNNSGSNNDDYNYGNDNNNDYNTHLLYTCAECNFSCFAIYLATEEEAKVYW